MTFGFHLLRCQTENGISTILKRGFIPGLFQCLEEIQFPLFLMSVFKDHAFWQQGFRRLFEEWDQGLIFHSFNIDFKRSDHIQACFLNNIQQGTGYNGYTLGVYIRIINQAGGSEVSG